MQHKHAVFDNDTHFIIDPDTRQIKNENAGRIVLIQHDHNSERFTFEIPQIVEGHDMLQCNKIEVHFININARDKETKADVYPVTDAKVVQNEAGENILLFSWLISQSATVYAGTVSFLIRFACIDEQGNFTYRWHTAKFIGVPVSDGINNSPIVVDNYSDVLAQWENTLFAAGYINAEAMQKDIALLSTRLDNMASLKDGSTTGDAELQDIRVSASGATFPSAGAAVRSQFKNLTDAVSKIMVENIYDPATQTNETITDNAFIQAGNIISNGNYFVTAPIDVSRFAGSKLYFNLPLHGSAVEAAIVSCFDANDNYLTNAGMDGLCYTVPIGASYIRLSVYKYSYWNISQVNDAFMILTADIATGFFPYGCKYLIPNDTQASAYWIAVDVRNNVVNFTVPSGSKFLHYTMKYFEGSKNAFFDFSEIAKAEDFSAFPSEETTLFSNGSDFFGPYIVRAVNNPDGDQPDSLNFTGASHAYSGNTDGVTSATGRSEISAILVDGVKRDEYTGFCNTLDIYWTNYIQATNTKKEDGTGREVLKEEYHLRFDGKDFAIENDITALEEVEIVRYYGLQIAQGVPGYDYNISYVGSHGNIVSEKGNSKSADTHCQEICIKRKDAPVECRFGLHPVGLGTFYCNHWYSAFDTDYGKSYFFMINSDEKCQMAQNQQVNFKGYYKFRYCD